MSKEFQIRVESGSRRCNYSCHQNLSERDEMGGARNIYVPKIGLSDGIVKRCIMVKYNDKLGI
jgi:hypothetical protein